MFTFKTQTGGQILETCSGGINRSLYTPQLQT
jgi:hypothetical protein